jgi:hypothetical protein
VSQGGQLIGDRPEPIEAQRFHGQTSERSRDLNPVVLAVALRIYLE